MDSQRLVLAHNETSVKFICPLCNKPHESHTPYHVFVEGGHEPICCECGFALEPAFMLMIHVFHELFRTACNHIDEEQGNDPEFELEYELPIDLAFEALEAFHPSGELSVDENTILQ